MTENHKPSDPEDQVALPALRKDIQAGLRHVHEMLAESQSKGNKAMAYVQALASILAEKGIIQPNELEVMMRRVRWELMQKPTPRVRLGSTREQVHRRQAQSISIARV